MEEQKKGSKKKSRLITAIFFASSIAVVIIIALVEFGGDQDRHIDGDINVNFVYLAGAVGCFLVALKCESAKYGFMLRSRKIKQKKSLGFTAAVIGKYYDNLTPAGAGGQGFQMYHLSQNGCDKGTAGGLPIIGFLGLQFAFVLLGIITMILGQQYIGDLVVIRVTAIVGLVFYAVIPVAIIVFAIAPKPLEKLVGWFNRLLGKIHLMKDPEASNEKAINSLRAYTNALREFGRSPYQIAVVFILSLIYQMAFMSLPYFVLRFFGADEAFIPCFFRVVFVYAAMTIIFTPGNSGAAEASFYMVFSNLSGGQAFWGMLVWRALCYYSWIVLGVIIQLADRIRGKGASDIEMDITTFDDDLESGKD